MYKVAMLKGIAFVIIYYTIGLLLSALAYWTYGQSYVHAPGLYHIMLFLTFAGGVLLMIVALVKHFTASSSSNDYHDRKK